MLPILLEFRLFHYWDLRFPHAGIRPLKPHVDEICLFAEMLGIKIGTGNQF